MHLRLIAPLLVSLFILPALAAQDTRTVTEPVIPPTCATLDAQLAATGNTLAPADESKLDTARIQQAIDHCAKDHGVRLSASASNNAFLSGPLQLRAGVTLIIGKGVTLFASRDPSLYAVSPGSCGIVSYGPHQRGCKPLISVDHAPHSAVMGEGTIDGRGGEKMLGSKYSWWDLAEQARRGGGQQCFRLIVAEYSNDFTLYRITLKNSPNFHVVYGHGDGFTVWGLKINTPQRLARNTDGVDPGPDVRNVTITHSYIRTGDDNVAIKGGIPGGVTNVTVDHDHFYWGHGMSIGSETNGGVSKIRVSDLSLDGPDNGIRIKSNGSRGGLTHDVIYDNVCIRNSPNPIILNTAYTANGPLKGKSPPSMRDIVLHNVRVSGGGKITFNGYDHTHRIGVALNGVQITDHGEYRYEVRHADITLGPEPTNLQLPSSEDSTIKGKPENGHPASCAEMFVPFPRK
jgi:polygalacturonase